MKKVFTGILGAGLCMSVTVTAFAAEINQDSSPKTGTTIMTTSKEASYTIVIPESAELTFDVERNPIGAIQYKEGNLEPDAYVTVALTEQAPLTNRVDKKYTIPYEIEDAEGKFEQVIYNELTAANTQTPLTACITKAAWDSAKSGKYTGSLTFTLSYTDPHAETTE